MNEKKIFVVVMLVITAILGYHVTKDNYLAKEEPTDNWQQSSEWKPIEAPKEQEQPQEPKKPETETDPSAIAYDEALKLAQQTNKKIVLFFHTSWCHYCNQMRDTTLKDPKVQNRLNAYIFVMVDADSHPALAKKYMVLNLPTYIVINRNELVLKKASGYRGPNSFLRWLD